MRALAIAAGIGVGASIVVRWRFQNWGATVAEQSLRLPGDELVGDPAEVITRAVTIEAPASEVWRWLVQMGRGRGGMYSYDWLENLIGLGIHSTEEIRDEWQHLERGDRIVLVPPGWLGMKNGYSLPVALIETDRAIVLRQAPPEHPWDAVWSFVIRPQPDGTCRLLSRSRALRRPGFLGTIGWAATQLGDPITLIMTRKMLLGIKSRAERTAAPALAIAGH
jgi:hypothetical protein